MKLFYKHLMMFALFVVTGWTTASALPTKLLTGSEAEAITYTWSDGTNVNTSNLAQTATTPAQIYSLLKFVYTDKRVPGPYTASYEGPSSFSSSYYTQDASVSNPNGSASYFLDDSYASTAGRSVYYGAVGQGWNITSTDNKPSQEGYTVLLVAVKDSYQNYATDSYYPSGSYLSDSASVVTFLDRMVDSVMVITNSVRVNEGGKNSGAVFNCSAYLNRFFFLSKGQARDISYGQNLYSTWYNKASRSSSYPSTSYFGNQSPFAEMFEQFSPNNGYVDSDASFSDITDIYSTLTSGATYNIRHDCPSALMQHHDFSVAGTGNNEHKPMGGLNLFIPDYRLESWFQTVDWVWASISSSGTVTNTTTQVDARSMYDDATFCQNGSSYAQGYNPNWTLDSHTGLYVTYDYQYIGQTYPTNRSSALYHFYNPHHFPKMNLYAIQLTADTTGVKRVEDGTTYYQIRVSWTSSLANLVGDGIVEYFNLFTIGADGTYSSLIERNSDEFNTSDYTIENGAYCYYYYVPQEEYSQYFTYIVSGQPVNDGQIFFTPTWSNEDDVFIPGWSTDEFLRLVLVDNISQYTTAGEFNNYNNKLHVVQGASPWLANDLATGDNLLHFVRIDDQGEETEFATLNYYRGGAAIFTSTNHLSMVGSTSKTFKVNTSGVTGTVTLTASSGFSVSPSSFTADGNDHTITVTHSGSTATGTVTITNGTTGVNTAVVNLDWASTQTAYASIDYGSMSGTSLSSSTDEKGGIWSYTGTGTYAYGLSGPISNVNYMYFTSDGSATYTFPAGVNLSTADVTITVQSGSYGTGYLYVNGSSIRYNGSTTTNTFSNVDVSNGTVTITSPSGSSGSSSYSLRIRSISITLNDAAVDYPTSGSVVIKPAVNYVFDNDANNTTLNYTARPFAMGDTDWLASAIDYVNDVFSAYTGDNSHSAYYNYYVTKDDETYTGPTIIRPTADIVMTSSTEMVQVKGVNLTTGATITTSGDFTVTPSSLTQQQALAGTAVTLTYTGNAAPGTTVTGTMTVTSGSATSMVNITYVVPDVPVLTTSTGSVTITAPAVSATFTVHGENLTSDVYLSVTEGLGVMPAFISAAEAMAGNVTVRVVPLDASQDVSGTVTVTSSGATSQTVTVNYTAPSTPMITVSDEELLLQSPTTTGTFTVTGSNLTGDINVASSNSDFAVVNNDGTVTVTYNGSVNTAASTTITVSSEGADSKTVTVNFWPTLYLIGEATGYSWAPNAGLQFTTTDGNTFTATGVNFNSNNWDNEIGDYISSFSFTTRLSSSASDWSSIDGNRLNPVCDTRCYIQPSYIADAAHMTLDNFGNTNKAFVIQNGTYTITVNLSEKYCVVTQVTVAAPTFSPAAGTYSAAQSVTLGGPTGATIYYTTDGSTPTTSSSVYSGAISVGSDMTIQAIAVVDGVSSSVASATYLIRIPSLTVSTNSIEIDGEEGTTGTFTVTGTNLTGNVTITAPTGFSVSPATITPTNGSVNQTVTITADGTANSGTITVASSGATTQSVDVTYTAPSGGSGLNASLDFTTLSNGTYSTFTEENWATTGTYVYRGEARINSGNNITYTVPSGYTNETVNVTITRSTYGSTAYMKVGINGANYSIKSTTSGGTATWSITVSSGDVITIMGCTSSGGNSNSPYMTGITITSSN